jgi:hypothetical protein
VLRCGREGDVESRDDVAELLLGLDELLAGEMDAGEVGAREGDEVCLSP